MYNYSRYIILIVLGLDGEGRIKGHLHAHAIEEKKTACYGLGKEDEVLSLPQNIQHLKIESCNNFSGCLSDYLPCNTEVSTDFS
ncbi:hypothetical protein RND71_036407 [Anisodus tanguticus]|uniref:Uncharacterized protein n=1 Tax=Anisodus tanguticus TaxID=243964 RepID=A0AAE1USQ4_9SOLA|nr:hypothetical protein RND71_036407 [Anisodus tanguticus]